jgi:hypothetical protein
MLQFHRMSDVVDLSASKLCVQCTGRAICCCFGSDIFIEDDEALCERRSTLEDF